RTSPTPRSVSSKTSTLVPWSCRVADLNRVVSWMHGKNGPNNVAPMGWLTSCTRKTVNYQARCQKIFRKRNLLGWPKKPAQTQAMLFSSLRVNQLNPARYWVQHVLRSDIALASSKPTPRYRLKNKTGRLFGSLTHQCSSLQLPPKPKVMWQLEMVLGLQSITHLPHRSRNT